MVDIGGVVDLSIFDLMRRPVPASHSHVRMGITSVDKGFTSYVYRVRCILSLLL